MEAQTLENVSGQIDQLDVAVLEDRSQLGYRLGNLLNSLRRSPVGILGAIIVTIVLFLAIAGPYIAPHEATDRNLRARFQAPGYSDETGSYYLGTDQLGRDILSRIIAGARVSVIVGVVAVLIAGTIGVLYGLVAGFVGGWLDAVMMRIVDALLGIPFIILVVAISGVVGAGLTRSS
jgi:peptide/nickel transport system permease protein